MNNIALCISGTKLRQAGFAPLVSIGIFADEEEKQMDRTTLIAGKPVFVLKHTPDYIIYEAIDRRVKPFDRDTPGVLSIGFTIPARCQLAGGKSPYTLLKEIYDRFISEYMVPVNDGRHSFLDKYADDAIFRELLVNYPLEPRKTPYVIMDQNPTGLTATLRLQESNIEEFFRDSQYEDFSRYKDIEIGFDCATTIGLENLEIPRLKRYEVFVNGRSTNKFMTKPNDFYTTGEIDTDSHIYNNISFYLKDLLDSSDNCYRNGNSHAVLDYSMNRINCTVGRVEKTYVCRIKVSGVSKDIEERVLSYVYSGQIVITIGERELASFRESENDFEFRVPYSYFNKSVSVMPFNVKIDGYEIGRTAEWNQRESSIYIKLTKTAFATPSTKNSVDSGSKPTPTDEKPPHDDSSDFGKLQSAISTPKAVLYMIGFFLLGVFVGGTVTYFLINDEHKKPEPTENTGNIPSEVEKDAAAIAVEEDIEDSQCKTEEEQQRSEEEKRKQEEVQAAIVAKAAADAKAAAELKKANEEAREKARAEILALVNEKNLKGCRNHPGWKKSLTTPEQYAIENVLSYVPNKQNQYDNEAVLIKKVKKYVESVGPFKNYDELLAVRDAIIRIENEHVKKYE